MTFWMQKENKRRDALYGTADSVQHDDESEKNAAQNRIWGLENMSEEKLMALGDNVSFSALFAQGRTDA